MQNDGKFLEIIAPLNAVLWVFLGIYLTCNYSEGLSTEFQTIGDSIYNSEWYLFPTKEQRLMQFIIVASKKPIILKGFGNLSYTHETFTKVNL